MAKEATVVPTHPFEVFGFVPQETAQTMEQSGYLDAILKSRQHAYQKGMRLKTLGDLSDEMLFDTAYTEAVNRGRAEGWLTEDETVSAAQKKRLSDSTKSLMQELHNKRAAIRSAGRELETPLISLEEVLPGKQYRQIPDKPKRVLELDPFTGKPLLDPATNEPAQLSKRKVLAETPLRYKTQTEGTVGEKLADLVGNANFARAWPLIVDIINAIPRFQQVTSAAQYGELTRTLGMRPVTLKEATEIGLNVSGQRFAGLDLTTIAAHPKAMMQSSATGIVAGAKAVWGGEDVNTPRKDIGNTPRNIREVFEKVSEFYKSEAARLAAEQFPGNPVAAKDAAKKFYTTLLDNDVVGKWAKHPEVSQAVFETVWGGMASPTVAKIAKPALKTAGRVTKAVVDVLPAGKAIRQSTTYMHGLEALENTGPAGEQLASRLRLAADYHAGNKAGVEQFLGEMSSAFAEIPEASQQKVYAALLDKAALDQLTASELEPYMKIEALRKRYFTISEPVLRRIAETDAGRVIEKATEVEDYVPRNIFKDAAAEVKFNTRARKGIKTAAAKKRVGDTEELFSPDLKARFEKSIVERGPKIGRAKYAQNVVEALNEHNMVYTPIRGEQAIDVAALTKNHPQGLKFVDVAQQDPHIAENVLLATLPEGESVNRHLIIPEPVFEQLKTVFNRVAPDLAGDAAHDSLEKIRMSVRAINSHFRTNVTLLSSVKYHATELLGNTYLPYLAHGIEGLPGTPTTAAAKQIAFIAAGLGDDASRVGRYKLAGGEEVTIGYLHDLMRDTAQLGQFKKGLGLDLTLEQRAQTGVWNRVLNAFRVVEEGKHKLIRGLKLDKANELMNNYAHAAVFLGALKGTKPNQIAAALDFAEQYIGLYHRLAPFEQKYLREIIPFWAFTKFINKRVLNSIVNEPERLMSPVRILRSFESEYGWQANVGSESVPPFVQPGFTAPPSLQPQRGTGFAMVVPDVGINMVKGWAEQDNLLEQTVGPVTMWLASLIAKEDPRTGTGVPNKIFPDFGRTIDVARGPGNIKDKFAGVAQALSQDESALGRAVSAAKPVLLPAFTDGIRDVINYMWYSGEKGLQDMAGQLALRYAIMRRFTGIPIYYVDPQKQKMFKLKDAAIRAQNVNRDFR